MAREPVAWVFVDGERFVAQDMNSGGYDYNTDSIDRARLWHTTDDAHEWAKHFRPRSDTWVLCPVFIHMPRQVQKKSA